MSIKKLAETTQQMTLLFSVSDTGPGISKEHQKELFDEFTQVDNSHTRQAGGTGLGLAIVLRLVDLMGGSIQIESDIGKGSHFFFELTLNKGSKLKQAPHLYIELFQQWHALIVDDNATNCNMLRQMLTTWGMSCDIVDSGAAALKQLQSSHTSYQIVLLDHQMPKMDGLELASRIGAIPELQDLKLIMLTSLNNNFDTHQEDQHRLNAFLRKPIHISPLFETILLVMDERSKLLSMQQPKPPRAVVSIRNERILLVEDNLVNQHVAIGMLKKLGFENVDLANNGLEAINMVGQHQYDLIFMDIQMPEMDGHAAATEIREMENRNMAIDATTMHTPIIALTAHALIEDREKSTASGMNDHLTKPLTGHVLLATMNTWLPAHDDTLTPHETTSTTTISHPKTSSVDEAALRQLHGDMGSGIALILDTFCAQLPKQMACIVQAIDNHDAETLKNIAHMLKGSCRNLGVLKLGELCAQLENLAKEGNLSSTMGMRDTLNNETTAVLKALKQSWLDDIR